MAKGNPNDSWNTANGISHVSIKLSFKLVVQNHSEIYPLLNSTRKGKLGGMQKSEHKGPSDDSDKQTQHEEWAVGEKERGKMSLISVDMIVHSPWGWSNTILHNLVGARVQTFNKSVLKLTILIASLLRIVSHGY